VSSASASTPQAPVVIRISPLAHFAVGFLTLGLLSVVMAGPAWFLSLLAIPVLLSAMVVRYRTVADAEKVTARTLLGSASIAWDDIAGLRFGRGTWAHAARNDGTELRLPAVTFGTLPLLTEVSGGRVPNPYAQR
jgi:PH (Pleckstrin Homology) domain-containing protein